MVDAARLRSLLSRLQQRRRELNQYAESTARDFLRRPSKQLRTNRDLDRAEAPARLSGQSMLHGRLVAVRSANELTIEQMARLLFHLGAEVNIEVTERAAASTGSGTRGRRPAA